MLHAVSLREGVALCACLVNDYQNDRLLERRDRRPARAKVQFLEGRMAMLAMYLQDIEIGVPSALMVRRDVFERGARLVLRPDIVSNIDTLWHADVLRHGHLVLVNHPLAQWHAGEHESVTRTMTDDAFYRELDVLRSIYLSYVDPALRPPPLRVAKALTRLVRSCRSLRLRRYAEAMRLIASAPYPRAWWLFARYLMRRAQPTVRTIVPRETLEYADHAAPTPVAHPA
jgi:hypothetical protein